MTYPVYSRAIRNVAAQNPTSHAGETKADGSAIEVQRIMLNDLRFEPRRTGPNP